MKLVIRSSEEQMSEVAAQILMSTMYQDKRVNLSITAGASPKGVYEIVTKIIKENPQDFQNVHYYNFDNMAMEGTSDGLTMEDLRKQYFSPALVPDDNIHILKVESREEIMNDICQSGGLEMMLIGLGSDGHFCGNMPGVTRFDKECYTIPFREKYQDDPWVKSVYKDSPLPEFGVTMGAAALMKARRVVMIVNGKNKAEAVKQFMTSEVDVNFPSSVLKMHPNFTVVLDAEAASLL